jgi:hypothetical protein
MQPFTALSAGILSTAIAVGQILPGHSIATVAVTGLPGEMYDINHDTGSVTALTISATLAAENPNAVLMTTPVTGFVGTNPAAGTGNVYAISVAGTTVTETLLNTTATAGSNVAELAVVGSRLYFCTSNAGVVGVLQSVPVGGGPVSMDLDLATVGALGLANAVAAIGTKVFVATFNSSPANTAVTPGELVEFDTATNTGRLVMSLPAGGFAPNGNPWNTGIVNMEQHPLQPNLLALCGVYGDLLYVDPVAGVVTQAIWTGLRNAGGNALASGSVNSFSFDPVSQDWIIGTRYGSIEHWVLAQQAELKITGIGSSATTTQNNITGLDYEPHAGAAGADVTYGAGCGGNGGWTPTDSAFGPPFSGNSSFRLAVFSANPGDLVVLLMDFQNTVFGSFLLPLDLTSFGAPGCFLRTGGAASSLVITTGSGAGGGQAIVPLPIPPGMTGLVLYRQWIELQMTPTNALGAVVSNARQLTVQ